MPEPNVYAPPTPPVALVEKAVADVLTDVEVARLLRCSPEKVRRWRYAVPPRGPRYFRLDRSVRYRRTDVVDFMEKVLVGTQQQPLDEPPPTAQKRSSRTHKQSGGRRAA